MINLGPQRQPSSLRRIAAQNKQVINAMTDYDHGRAAALRGAPRCLGCDPAGTQYPDWYAGWDSIKKEREQC
jgi:hypothetical protein